MRALLKVTVPVEAGNKTITDGTLPRVIQSTIEMLRPEAAYFYVAQGHRTGLMFFDLKDPGQIPVICEPLFQGLNAAIEIIPVMNPQDLQAGLTQAQTGKR